MEYKFKQGTKLERSGKIPEESMKNGARTKKKSGQVQVAPSGRGEAPDGRDTRPDGRGGAPSGMKLLSEY